MGCSEKLLHAKSQVGGKKKNPASSVDLGARCSQKGGNNCHSVGLNHPNLPESYPAGSEGTTVAACQSPSWVLTCSQAPRKASGLVLDVPGSGGSFLLLPEVMVSLLVLKNLILTFWSASQCPFFWSCCLPLSLLVLLQGLWMCFPFCY